MYLSAANKTIHSLEITHASECPDRFIQPSHKTVVTIPQNGMEWNAWFREIPIPWNTSKNKIRQLPSSV